MRAWRCRLSGVAALALTAGLCVATPAAAQQRPPEWSAFRSTSGEVLRPSVPAPQESRQKSRIVSVGKWVTLLASAGASAWGFNINVQADDDFEELEQVCENDPDRCETAEDGTFVDAELEARFQDILDRDRSARAALIGGQIGLAATVVLFILDLNNEEPPDIPFEPPRLSVGPRGTELSASVALPNH